MESEKAKLHPMQAKGGRATLKKHGRKHFRDLAYLRWDKERREKRKAKRAVKDR